MISNDIFLDEKRQQLYAYLRIASMSDIDRNDLIRMCEDRLEQLYRIEEMLTIDPIPHFITDADVSGLR